MVLLDPITMDTVVDNLKQRYRAREFYTYIGKVVVSINPYQRLTIYSSEYIEKYRSRNMFELPPHMLVAMETSTTTNPLQSCLFVFVH
jgi:myosin-1